MSIFFMMNGAGGLLFLGVGMPEWDLGVERKEVEKLQDWSNGGACRAFGGLSSPLFHSCHFSISW
ncbi:MAG: hypothetical protein K5893_09240 [Prevotella sp.]|nr:hypothetical protein [Prevotella sp.]